MYYCYKYKENVGDCYNCIKCFSLFCMTCIYAYINNDSIYNCKSEIVSYYIFDDNVLTKYLKIKGKMHQYNLKRIIITKII